MKPLSMVLTVAQAPSYFEEILQIFIVWLGDTLQTFHSLRFLA